MRTVQACKNITTSIACSVALCQQTIQFASNHSLFYVLMQELYDLQQGDICGASQYKLEKMLVELRGIAALSRNLPTSTTLYLQGLDGFQVGTECFSLETSPSECDERHVLPPSLRFLFMLVQKSAACMDIQDDTSRSKQSTYASIARVAVGLLSDLAANDEAVRTLMQSKPDPKESWQAGMLWQGVQMSCLSRCMLRVGAL
jgi:hypothetical protein